MKQQGVLQLTAVLVGGAICLPVIMVGQMLGITYGLLPSLLAILAGNAVLLGIGLVMAKLSVRHRETTAEVAGRYLGPLGARLLAGTMLTTLIGWFAIQLDLISLVVGGGLLGNIGIGLIITLLAMGGLKSITRIASVSSPLLIITMGITAFLLVGGPIVVSPVFSSLAISMVIATAIGSAFDLPTYFRHAKNSRSAKLSAILTFGVAMPLIECLGVYIGLKAPALNLVAAMTGVGGAVWGVWVVAFLLLAGWTTNNSNLFSATACLKTLIPKVGTRICTLVIGICGTALSCLPLLARFPLTLNLMGVLIIAVGASVLVSHLLGRNDSGWSLIACAMGGAVGLMTSLGVFALTGVPLIDAAATSGILTLIVGRKVHETVND